MGIAGVIAYTVSPVSPIHTTPLDAARTYAGGFVAAPVIGLLLGHIARRFSNQGYARRLWVALRDLYLATYLFLLAAGVGHVVGGLIARHLRGDNWICRIATTRSAASGRPAGCVSL